jgi:UDP-glucuronate 4-epimerase
LSVLITGAAGFIGMHVARALLARGEQVLGIDNLNAYYDPQLKRARVAELERFPGFRFELLDVAEQAAVRTLLEREREVDRIVHLAAQAGVRYSIENPAAYIATNIVGHFALLEGCRHRGGIRHFVYASSSSVYGGNEKLPFAVDDRVDHPVSLYAATKAADELISHCYSHLYGIRQTGLRFFTVYGPWGRPDMAAFLFLEAIFANRAIRVFNGGDMRRDFTYIDDIVAGTLAALERSPVADGTAPHRVYNLGNSRSEPLMTFIATIEKAAGRKALVEFAPMQPGDVKETFADIAASRRDLGFEPRTTIAEGIPRLVDWYRQYYRV